MTRACLLLLPILLGSAACESSARLHVSPCYNEGGTQPCTAICGVGVRTCKAGSWSACVVPPVGLPCSNSCGDGTLLCEDNQIKGVCEVSAVVKDCSSICGPGTQTCANNQWQSCTAPLPKQPKLTATIRDFHITFPDMNHDGIDETGIVAATLGPDDKPVYAHTGPTATVSGPDTFAEWYRDVPGVNTSTLLDIPLAAVDAAKRVYSYTNTSFFPIDNQLFGNEGQPHNYAFTAEIATRFVYRGGETFTFSGDDDVFVFINRTLAIDLGGIHSIMSKTVDLDAQADYLGMVQGGIYPMHIFFAERHMVDSDFVVETTISEFDVCN
jgi:fibro-slime domain-containing protein